MTARMGISCPRCGTPLSVKAALEATSVRCPKCGNQFIADSQLGGAPAARAASLETDTRALATRNDATVHVPYPPSADNIRDARSSDSKAARLNPPQLGSKERQERRVGTGASESGAGALDGAANDRAVSTGGEATEPIGRIGRFELRRALGAGGFGMVYLAHDPLLDRDVALKVTKFASNDGDKVKRFLREARAAARLRHPNIVAVYESGQAGDDYYIASGFIEGVPLSVRISEDPPNLAEAVQWALRAGFVACCGGGCNKPPMNERTKRFRCMAIQAS